MKSSTGLFLIASTAAALYFPACGFKNLPSDSPDAAAPTALVPPGGTPSSQNNQPTGTPSSTPSPTPTASPTATPSAATFSQVYQQILQPKCLSCHSSGSPNFSSYTAFAKKSAYIVAGNPEHSGLYTEVASGSMPMGGKNLTASELALVYSWIEAGALNN
jgi:mono/diheme cytochrome c family protein